MLSIIWKQVEDAVRKGCSAVECFVFFFTGMYDFCFHSYWYSSVKDDFQELFRLQCFAFCFWSVAKCLLNTDCEQQWIKKGPLFKKTKTKKKVKNCTEWLALTLLYKTHTHTQNVLYVNGVFYRDAQQDCS